MERNRRGLIGASLISTLLVVAIGALVRPPVALAVPQAILKVQSTPTGVTLPNPTCYTLATGTCGTTNWTSKNTGSIPTTIYKYPVVTTIGGTSYTLSANSLTGCNEGTAGSKPNVCKVSVAGGKTSTISANYILTPSPPPFSACTNNLVQNPSFESTGYPPGWSYLTWGGWLAWQIKDSTTTHVQHWTQENSAGLWMFAINHPVVHVPNNSTPPNWQPSNAFDGSKVAVMLGVYPAWPVSGAVNTLYAPTVGGVAYDVSAELATIGYPGSTTYDLRLRNSSTGALSTIVTQTVGQQTGQWTLLHGSITDNGSYDQVLVRYNGPGVGNFDYFGLIDDVHVCRHGGTHWWQNNSALGGLVTFVLAGGGLIFLRTRHSKPHGKSKASQVAVGDIDGDGKSKAFKVSENESPRLMNHVLRPGNQLSIVLAVLAIAGAAIFIAGTAGGVWKNKINSPTSETTTENNNPTVTCESSEQTRTPEFLTICDSNGRVIKTESMSSNDHPTPADINSNIEAAMNSGNFAALEGYMAPTVKVIIAASEGIGDRTPIQAVSDLSYLSSATTPWDFNLPEATIAGYIADGYPSYFPTGAVVGKSANNYLISFTFDNSGKISGIFMTVNAGIL